MEKKYILKENGIHVIGSHFVEIPDEIQENELHEFRIVHRESLIDDLCMWITECKNTGEKILMKEDLKTLVNWKDDYILSSNETNMYLNSDYELFNGVCEELIELATQKTSHDMLPPITAYTEYLAEASKKFNVSINQCRSLYGSYTVEEWKTLLNAN